MVIDYYSICERIMNCDDRIRDVYIINNEARLAALSGKGEMHKVDEAQFAEILEDLLFMVGSRKHHENVFGRLEYIHIRHRNADAIVLPFEKDKVLCICMKEQAFNEVEIVDKLKHEIMRLYQYV